MRIAAVIGVFIAGCAFFAGSAGASTVFSEGWEQGLGNWTVSDTSATPDTTNDPQWQVLNHPENILVASPGINPNLVTLPDSGQLPAAHGGTHAAWFGDTTSGTFCGADWSGFNVGASKNGCTSREAFSGTLTSPTFDLSKYSSATLHFFAWWEIEAVDSNSYDLMQVQYSTDNWATSTTTRLNPVSNPAGSHDQSYSNNGLEASPSWHEYIVDLTPAAGQSNVQIRFTFSTNDELYNGFRGWLIDDISVNAPGDAGTPTISGAANTCSGGQGATTVVNGSNFVEGSTLLVDGSQVPASVESSQRIETSFVGAGSHTFQVQSPGGQQSSNIFTGNLGDCAFSVSGVSPSSGPADGGTTVSISGANFTGATGVNFGSNPATSFTVVDDSHITAVSPPGTGTVDVTVSGPGGTSATGPSDQFTYTPVISSAANTCSGGKGATTVVNGSGFLEGSTLLVDGSQIPASVESSQRIETSFVGTGNHTFQVQSPSEQESNLFTGTLGDCAFSVSGVSPSTGPPGGGTTVSITGANFTGATGVNFGSNPATSFKVVDDSHITAVSPPGTGTVDVTVTGPGGTNATSPSDRFSYVSSKPPPPPPPGPPAVAGPSGSANQAVPVGTQGAAFNGTVNPEGLPTTAYFRYGLDSSYGAAADGPTYTSSTPVQQVGSDFSAHAISASVSGLVPNALYHVQLVASNGAGTTYGQDVTFMTKKDPPPPPPVLGKSFDVTPVSGLVLIRLPVHPSRDAADHLVTKGQGFVPLTEARQLPSGSQIDARQGTIQLVTAGQSSHKLQNGNFSGGLFSMAQDSHGVAKGLTTLSLLEGLFPGGPSYSSCKAGAADAPGAFAFASKGSVLQTLRASANGRFRTRGRYAAATVRGTGWTMSDRCDGTLVAVQRHTVAVTDFVRHVTVLVHQGHQYLAKAPRSRHR